MNYRKINLLYILKIGILGFLVFVCVYLNNHLSELHKTELDKNHKAEEKLVEKDAVKKLELEEKYIDKEEAFSNYLYYFFLIFISGVAVITFVNGKIDSENKKLDEFEKEA